MKIKSLLLSLIGLLSVLKNRGLAKIRFRVNGQPFSYGVGRLDNDLYKEGVINTCKDIALNLRPGKFNADNWKLTYFDLSST